MAWPAEQGMILAHEMSWRCRHPHSSLQPWVIPWLSSLTKQLLHEEINVCATNITYMAWTLELKARCIQFALNTVIKSDPLLTKLITCLGKEGARLSEYTCTHWKRDCYEYQTTPAEQRLPYNLQIHLRLFSLNHITAKTLYASQGVGRKT